jgi:hypothetical protein
LSTNPSEGVDEEQYAHPPGITPLTTYRSPVIGCLADISTQFCDAGRVGCSGLGWISAMPSSHPGRRRREIDESQRRYAAQPARPLRLWCQSAESSVCLFGLPHLSSLLQRLERQAMIGRGATVPHARATPERLSAFYCPRTTFVTLAVCNETSSFSAGARLAQAGVDPVQRGGARTERLLVELVERRIHSVEMDVQVFRLGIDVEQAGDDLALGGVPLQK